ncbi:MAG: hypothetical protein ACKOWQ_04465 [Aquirufa sp.]
MKAFQRIFLIVFAFWLLIGQVGFAFQSKKCLITGSKKWNINNNASCCKRDVAFKSNKSFTLSKSSCCAYNQYVIKFNFSVEKLKSFALNFISTGFSNIQFSFLWKKDFQETAKIFWGHFFHPPSHSVRLAILQSYLI